MPIQFWLYRNVDNITVQFIQTGSLRELQDVARETLKAEYGSDLMLMDVNVDGGLLIDTGAWFRHANSTLRFGLVDFFISGVAGLEGTYS